MKQHLLLIVTMLTVGLTSLLFLNGLDRSSSAQRPSTAHQRRSPSFAKSYELPADRNAQRWLRGEPRHWRDCMLQR